MAICIVGMHRSGTSMITRLLNLAGLYLGNEVDLGTAQPDNLEGNWEHFGFYTQNERLLAAMGGSWNLPPVVQPGWEKGPELEQIRRDSAQVVTTFAGQEHWGWKDSRNSVLLPFWQQFLPAMRLLVCIRDPEEVASSINARDGFSLDYAYNLWLAYYQAIEAFDGAERVVVTHYDAYFPDTKPELRRVLGLLGLPNNDDAVESGSHGLSAELRHHRAAGGATDRLPSAVGVMYERLVTQSGPVYAEVAAAGSSEARPVRPFTAYNSTVRLLQLESMAERYKTDRRWIEDSKGHVNSLYQHIQALGQQLNQVVQQINTFGANQNQQRDELRTTVGQQLQQLNAVVLQQERNIQALREQLSNGQ